MSDRAVMLAGHLWRDRDGSARLLHVAACPCWRQAPSTFGLSPRPRSSLWDYLASPFRTRGQAWL